MRLVTKKNPAGRDEKIKVGVVGVIHRDGKFLLAQRMKRDEAFGKWVFPGGGLMSKEEIEEGVRRECFEEVGLDVRVHHLITATRSTHAGKKNVALIYWATPRDGEAPITSLELANPSWFTIEDALDLDLMPATRDVLNVILSGREGEIAHLSRRLDGAAFVERNLRETIVNRDDMIIADRRRFEALVEAAKESARLAPRVPDGNGFGYDWTIPNPVIAVLAEMASG